MLAEPSPPLRFDRRRAVAAAVAAEGEIGARLRHRLVGELAIGRVAAPRLVAAVEEVEADRLRHDRHVHAADRDADAALAQKGLHAGRPIEPEAGAAGEHDGVDALDRHLGLEAGGVPVRRRAAEREP